MVLASCLTPGCRFPIRSPRAGDEDPIPLVAHGAAETMWSDASARFTVEFPGMGTDYLRSAVHLPHLQGGSWPDWIAAIGSVSALIFAALAVRGAVQANRHQARQVEMLQLEQQAAREREERAQAELIFAWWVRASYEDGPIILNTSGMPVFDFIATVRDFRGESQTYKISVLAPCENPTHYFHLPSASKTTSFDRSTSLAGKVIGVEIEFTDRSWIRWRRDIRGKLMRLGAHDPYPEVPAQHRPFDPAALRRAGSTGSPAVESGLQQESTASDLGDQDQAGRPQTG